MATGESTVALTHDSAATATTTTTATKRETIPDQSTDSPILTSSMLDDTIELIVDKCDVNKTVSVVNVESVDNSPDNSLDLFCFTNSGKRKPILGNIAETEQPESKRKFAYNAKASSGVGKTTPTQPPRSTTPTHFPRIRTRIVGNLDHCKRILSYDS